MMTMLALTAYKINMFSNYMQICSLHTLGILSVIVTEGIC